MMGRFLCPFALLVPLSCFSPGECPSRASRPQVGMGGGVIPETHHACHLTATSSHGQEEWSDPLTSVQDINELFVNFCQGKLESSPWSELCGLQPADTKIVDDQLVNINLKGFLIINSQPAVNGEKYDSPSDGWGGPGGYVYQKAYAEFFCAKEKLDQLIEKSKAFPSLTYIAVNREGESMSNISANTVNTVKWVVFPGKEIIEDSVDPASFMVWKDEAFEIWSKGWACLFPEGDPSRELLEQVQKSYYLVSLVDNDYIDGDLFAVFNEI